MEGVGCGEDVVCGVETGSCCEGCGDLCSGLISWTILGATCVYTTVDQRSTVHAYCLEP